MNDKEQLLISVYFEKKLNGTLSQAEAEQLEIITLNDAQAADFYFDLCVQHIGLEEHKASLDRASIIDFKSEKNTLSSRLMPFALAASLFLAIFLIFKLQTTPKTQAIVGMLKEVNHCTWAESTLPTAKGSVLHAGVMKLEKGIAEIELDSGVYVQVEAPAHFELIDAMHCIVHSGTVMADVPEQAKGFQIDTPTAKVVDHGTRFMVSYQPGQNEPASLIEVLDGDVEVRGHSMSSSQHFFKGDRILAMPSSISNQLKNEEYGYIKNAPKSVENSLQVTSGYGKGLEATIVKNNDLEFHYIPTLVLLKNTASNLSRKGYLRFDLTEIINPNFNEVSLSFNMVNTGLGTNLNMNASHFEVYGILEDYEHWDTDNLTWQNAPGNHDDGDKVNLEQTLYLGSFSLEKGISEETKTLKNDALRSFIRNDSNKLVSFIIIRTNIELGKNSIVHGFANSKHPSVSPPKLLFEY